MHDIVWTDRSVADVNPPQMLECLHLLEGCLGSKRA